MYTQISDYEDEAIEDCYEEIEEIMVKGITKI